MEDRRAMLAAGGDGVGRVAVPPWYDRPVRHRRAARATITHVQLQRRTLRTLRTERRSVRVAIHSRPATSAVLDVASPPQDPRAAVAPAVPARRRRRPPRRLPAAGASSRASRVTGGHDTILGSHTAKLKSNPTRREGAGRPHIRVSQNQTDSCTSAAARAAEISSEKMG